MKPAPEREETLFRAAAKLAGTELDLFLSAACHGDPALRLRLEAMLAAHQASAATQTAGNGPDRPALRPDLTTTPEEAVGQILGRYKLVEKLGEGGYGAVYVAEQTKPVRQRVALKVIKLGIDAQRVIARFETERHALAMMDHPNIAKVFDAGTTNSGRPFFVMELVRGVRITEFCDQNNLLIRERLQLFIKVCQAIQHAHQKGVIHRDIKPSNLLVSSQNGVAVPKVIDFGIAKATEGRLTDATVSPQLHQFIGTPAYLSPEQAAMSGLDIDTRSDIYSLGVLLYELLSGSTPFDAKVLASSGIDAIGKTIRESEPPRPSTRLAGLEPELLTTIGQHRSTESPKLVHQLQGDLDWIVMKCLEKDRARRYETANALAADLQRHLRNETVGAHPPNAAYRLQAAIRRNKVSFATALLAAAGLIAGICITAQQASEAKRGKALEEERRLAAQKERDQAQAAQTEARQAQQAESVTRREAERQLYAAQMHLAQRAWEENNLGALGELLDRTEHYPSRGFEWVYWQHQAHLALKTFRGHAASVTSAAYSQDGRRMVTGSDDRSAKIWDVATGGELLTLRGHSNEIRSVVFSPDGRRIATGGFGTVGVRVWDASTGKELVALRGKGTRLAVHSVAFSPDGLKIATGSADRSARIWDAADGREILKFNGHTDSVVAVCFSPDGQRIATASDDHTVKLWDLTAGVELLTLAGHASGVSSVTFSPNGQRILTASWDRTAKVWDAPSGRELLTLKGHAQGVCSAAFSPDGSKIVTGSSDKTIQLWEAATGRPILTLKGHADPVRSVEFSPDGLRILSGSQDRTARLWEVPSRPQRLLLRGHRSLAGSVRLSADTQRAITTSWDNTAKVWETAGGQELLTLQGHTDTVLAAAFSSDGQWIITGSSDKTAKLWDAATGREALTLHGHADRVDSVIFSPNNRQALTGSADKTAKLWDVTTGKVLLTLNGHSEPVLALGFSPDGSRVLTGSRDLTAKIWNAVNGTEVFTLKGHNHAVVGGSYSSDGQWIVTASLDRTARIWNANTAQQLLTLKGHADAVLAATFSPDGQRVLTGSSDKTVRLWETQSGRELLPLSELQTQIQSVAFSPDGQRIAAASTDGTDAVVRFWLAARPAQIAAWQEEERSAEQRLTPLQRQFEALRDREQLLFDRSLIKNWLVLGPIPIATNQIDAEVLNIDLVAGEGELKPAAGESLNIADREVAWQTVNTASGVIDFNEGAGGETASSASFAVCYLRSEKEQRGVQILVASDDQAKVYFNGKELLKSSGSRSFYPDQDIATGITLYAGVNVLVMKVLNESGRCLGSVRLIDEKGNPLPGVRTAFSQ